MLKYTCERGGGRRIKRERERERRRVIIGSGTSLQVLFTIYSCKSLIAPDGDRWIDDIGSQRGDWKEEVRCARVFEALLLSTIVRRRRRKIKGPPFGRTFLPLPPSRLEREERRRG